jgi:hypothetical protein
MPFTVNISWFAIDVTFEVGEDLEEFIIGLGWWQLKNMLFDWLEIEHDCIVYSFRRLGPFYYCYALQVQDDEI